MQEAKENKKFYPFSIYQDFESHTAASSVNKLKGEFASKKKGKKFWNSGVEENIFAT